MTLLTVKEFAALIRVHPRTIYRRIWEQRQPGLHRIGRDYRIDPDQALGPPLEPPTAPISVRPALGGLYTRV